MPERNRDGRYLSIGVPATFVDHVRPDGLMVRWESRRHRKHQKPAAGSTWWAPRARGWWIAVLFAIGSLLFALGSVPAYASAVGSLWDTVTYFAGSLFFTSASFLSYREAVDAAPEAENPAHRRFFTYQPGRIDWWATAVQFALNSGADDPGASGLENGVERRGEAGVPVMQDELHARLCIFQVHQEVGGRANLVRQPPGPGSGAEVPGAFRGHPHRPGRVL